MFIVLEGTDGSGKATQTQLIVERLKAVGHEVETFEFPRYQVVSSIFVRNYLEGKYGAASQISPYTASLFYALDRYDAAPKIKQAISEGKIVIADRYVGSNMAHQGSKFSTIAEQRGFFLWEDSLEYELLGIPRPDINIYLRVPVEISAKLISDRSKKTDSKADQHEADVEHLKKSVATYDLLCRLFPKDFTAINCAPNGQLSGIVEVNDQIWDLLKPLLPKPKNKPKEKVVKLAPKTRVDQKPKAPETIKSILEKTHHISSKKPSTHALKLFKAEPRNELDLLEEIVKPAQLEKWTYNQKQKAFKENVSKLLTKAHYQFDTGGAQKTNKSGNELINAPVNERSTYGQMIEKISEVHPLVGNYLRDRNSLNDKPRKA